jgi:hypothetical protein
MRQMLQGKRILRILLYIPREEIFYMVKNKFW